MSSSTTSNGLKPVTMALVVGLGLVALVANAGCDEMYTSSLGMPQYSPSYWGSLGMGTQNVASWGGLVNPWYTSSLGLPEYPPSYWW